ncbi:hypothetical protein, partial [Elizabethkingia miricola]|uniref:hypothetical protein n=1 Tax=Elizabethkingia miricola TaxID=172045 RepID=UPI001CA40073
SILGSNSSATRRAGSIQVLGTIERLKQYLSLFYFIYKSSTLPNYYKTSIKIGFAFFFFLLIPSSS